MILVSISDKKITVQSIETNSNFTREYDRCYYKYVLNSDNNRFEVIRRTDLILSISINNIILEHI